MADRRGTLVTEVLKPLLIANAELTTWVQRATAAWGNLTGGILASALTDRREK